MPDGYKYAEVKKILEDALDKVGEDPSAVSGDGFMGMVKHGYEELQNFFTFDIVEEGTRKITELKRQLHNANEMLDSNRKEVTRLEKECKRLFDMNRNYKADDDRHRSHISMLEIEKEQLKVRLKLSNEGWNECKEDLDKARAEIRERDNLCNHYINELAVATRPIINQDDILELGILALGFFGLGLLWGTLL